MHRLVLAGLLPALIAVPGIAQDPPIVTEAEFLSALDAYHPAVAESFEAVAVARARVVEASTLDNIALGFVREDPQGPVEQTDWALSWQVPDADRGPTIEAREQAAGADEARLAQRLLLLRLAMREVYAEWAFALARRELLAAQVERVEALAEREELRAQRGEASGLEAQRLALAASGLQTLVALAGADAEKTRARARGWSPAMPADARPLVPELPMPAQIEGTHPLVTAAERDLAAAMAERKAAGRYVLSPEVLLGWQTQEVGPVSVDGPVLGFAWSVPVFARKQAERATSDARIEGATARLEKVRREVDSSRSGALASFEILSSALAGAREALEGNGRMLDGTEAAFRLGETDLTDLLQTHRSVAESELAVLDLHRAALAAHRDLERLSGTTPDPDDYQLMPSNSQSQEDLP